MTDLIAPEIVFCGFQRMSTVSHDQYYKRQASLAEATEITITISINDGHTFHTPIHKQADIQTLARTIEGLLAERRLVVACLIDLGSDNILRWSDTVENVLDSDSVVGVIPLSKQTLMRTTQPTHSANETIDVDNTRGRPLSSTSPIPQMEFIQVTPVLTRPGSYPGSIPRSESDEKNVSRRKTDGQRSSTKALKALKANAKRLSDLAIHPPTVEPYAETWLPPLPMSPIPKAVQSRLTQICSNAVLLLNFARYCARKKTLCELLCWLDTTHNVSEDYIGRIYLDREAPLKLNLPREVSTAVEARELLRDGALAWSETGFEVSQEGLTAKLVETENPNLFRAAAIVFTSPSTAQRKSFLEYLTKALDPKDVSILPLKDRTTTATRQAVLNQVCNQFFVGDQIHSQNYFEYGEFHMTKPERTRRGSKRITYGVDDKKISPASSVLLLPLAPATMEEYVKTQSSSSPAQSFKTASSLTQVESKADPSASVRESMTLSDHDTTPTQSVKDIPEDRYANGISINGPSNSIRKAQKLSSILGHTVDANGVVRSGTAAPVKRMVSHDRSFSMASSILSDDSATVDAPQEDSMKRQTKLRAMLGLSSQEIQKVQAKEPKRSSSPTPSIASRMSAQSGRYSVTSHMSRAERDEASDRRLQARKAAKLYAKYGSENMPQALRTRKSVSDFDPALSRPGSSASIYSTASFTARTGSARSLYTPTGPGRYKPDRGQLPQSGLRLRSFSLFKNGRREPSSNYDDEDRDSISDFPPKSPSISQRSPKHYTNGFEVPPIPAKYKTDPHDINLDDPNHDPEHQGRDRIDSLPSMKSPRDHDDLAFLEEDEEEDEDEEGEAIVQDVRTNMKLRQLLGNDAPTSNQ